MIAEGDRRVEPGKPAATTAHSFAVNSHRAVLTTWRRDGTLQSSPIAVVAGDGGRLWVSTRAASAKARNLARDPRTSLCLLSDSWYGPWMHVEGKVAITRLPDALPALVQYYRRAAGEHPNWTEYRDAMAAEERVLLEITVTGVTQPTS